MRVISEGVPTEQPAPHYKKQIICGILHSLRGGLFCSEDCPLNLDFNFAVDGNKITCSPVTIPTAETYYWEFGDGNFSRFQSPIHNYAQEDIFEICLTATREENGNTCEQTRCKKIDLSSTPGECQSILDGSCPYPASDPFFQLVIEDDERCCEEWDVFCELKYIEFEDQSQFDFDYGVDYDYNYQLDFKDSDKVLIDRLLSVPEFKDRYIDHACFIRDQVFNSDHLYSRIDSAADLIREDLLREPNYLYTKDYFEYNVGNGTGGGGNATIPALKYVFDNRFPQIDKDLDSLGTDCSNLGSPVVYGDVVINEFVASNSEPDGNPDPAGGFADWIEIFNNTRQTLDLFDFYMSDNETDPLKWQFPEGTVLEPNGYLIVWADKDPEQSGVHADFKLSKSGEFLSLSHRDGTMLDSLTFGEQETNIASARIPNGVGNFLKQAATFGKNNETMTNANDLPTFAKNVFVYPNPAVDQLNISFRNFATSDRLILKIEDLAGRTILAESRTASIDFRLDISDFVSGIYFLKMEIGGERLVEKLIVK